MQNTRHEAMDSVTAMQNTGWPSASDCKATHKLKTEANEIIYLRVCALANRISRTFKLSKEDAQDMMHAVSMKLIKWGPYNKPEHPKTSLEVDKYISRCIKNHCCQLCKKSKTNRHVPLEPRRHSHVDDHQRFSSDGQRAAYHATQLVDKFYHFIATSVAVYHRPSVRKEMLFIVRGMLEKSKSNAEQAREMGIRVGSLQQKQSRTRRRILEGIEMAVTRGELPKEDAEVYRIFMGDYMRQRTKK